jgi:hypothetical protein
MFPFSLLKRAGWLQDHQPTLKIVGEGVEFCLFFRVLMKSLSRQVKIAAPVHFMRRVRFVFTRSGEYGAEFPVN